MGFLKNEFALECPKCGTFNTAATGLFAKKIIKCVACNEEIDVKQSKLISKKCECGTVVVWDQAKKKEQKCPSCGEVVSVANATTEYKFINAICPQCSCQIEVDKTLDTDHCVLCGATFNVQELIAKSKLVSDTGVSIIEYKGGDNIVYKHPIEDFNTGSQLIVREGQEAIFFLNGRALDLFGPGRHTLETENLPILKSVCPLPTGRQTPFKAEVYFINTTAQSIKWGTDSRVRFIEPNTGIPLDIGACGELKLVVSDARKLLVKLVGTSPKLNEWLLLHKSLKRTNEGEIAETYDGFFRPMIMTGVKTNLASAIKSQKINILEIEEHLQSLSEMLKEKLAGEFEEYGFSIASFYVTNVLLPEEDRNFAEMRTLIADSYLRVRREEVEANVVAAKRQKILEGEMTALEVEKMKAERARIKAQADADAMLARGTAGIALHESKGMADARVMEAKGYNQKDVLQADVQKEYARGIGNMGGGNGGGGGIMSEMLGFGVGMAAMDTIGEKLGGAMKNMTASSEEKTVEIKPVDTWDCSCGNKGISGKFCTECGNAKPVVELWDCTHCGTKGIKGKFCSECGAPKPEVWDCPSCGAKGNSGKFCSECGSPMPKNDKWDCSCGAKGITGKFCSACGSKREDN